ncbi:MAG: hypothetical protein A2359_04640 [Candidatus Moranbacteria bacterium RIFOXYB1_FULL_43_19]|nr:MAG: hypothetical protein A2359_04640 [Candidatus Moranbacteria bacterium RIFOXYB1_FULL_43_19]OGI29017.1 MAG: hypothetical protein A2184_04905 [Candidatus Moranbacteria bacterium RIFOXYA1_FULL_44_7]OGI33895.1 MAG: hypothetical protein A2420_01745 [Candidatus Moranbacteria bacterium RIFOXYC1_FULL_44_13]OGI38301.1 MAG: hypothetical protein A2612_03760 [Candidatus Moranbacteria bacterium RIFOXYD1_FULL_44_12]
MKNKHSFLLKGNNNIGVLLLHGWTSPPEEFLPLAKYLNSFGYTVSAPLLRGHGTKPEDLLGVKWEDWLEDSRKALEELKKTLSLTTAVVRNDADEDLTRGQNGMSVARDETKIFVGGISMGGNLSMMLSGDDSVAGILAMGPSVKFRFHKLDKLVIAFMGLTKVYRKKYYPPWVRKKMGKRDVYMYYPVESAKEVMKLADETRKYLPAVIKPILIMQSTSDHMVSKRSPQIIADGVKSKIKEIFWIENAYHVFAEKKEVWEKIGEFIKKILSAKS